MPKASLIIRFSENKIELEGNDDLLWYINEKVKRKSLKDILEIVKEFKNKRRKEGKMNIIIVNLPSDYSNIIEEFKDDFNIIIEKALQTKITKFFEK